MQLSWEIEGEKELSKRLGIIADEIKDWKPAFEEAADKLKNIFENDVFATQGGAIGERWAPLKPAYLAQKLKQGYPATPLIKTGLMKSNFESEANAMYGRVWNDTDYFKYHQSKAPRSKLPRRVMMKLGNSQKTLIVKVFHTYWYRKTHKK